MFNELIFNCTLSCISSIAVNLDTDFRPFRLLYSILPFSFENQLKVSIPTTRRFG